MAETAATPVKASLKTTGTLSSGQRAGYAAAQGDFVIWDLTASPNSWKKCDTALYVSNVAKTPTPKVGFVMSSVTAAGQTINVAVLGGGCRITLGSASTVSDTLYCISQTTAGTIAEMTSLDPSAAGIIVGIGNTDGTGITCLPTSLPNGVWYSTNM